MEIIEIWPLDVPEKKVIDLLKYLEKETQIELDIISLSGFSAVVKTEVEEHNINLFMPAEFYSLRIFNSPLIMKMRFCPFPYCDKIKYIELVLNNPEVEFEDALVLGNIIQNAVPEMDVFLTLIDDGELTYNVLEFR